MKQLSYTFSIAIALCFSPLMTQAASISAEAIPSTISRNQSATIKTNMNGRVPGDSIHHYMLWTENTPIANALRVEGKSYIIADSNKTGEFPLNVSQWKDGKYLLKVRAYYHAQKESPLERLDTTVEIKIQGGTPPNLPTVEITTPALSVGENLTLEFKLPGQPQAIISEAKIISRGQQIFTNQEIPETTNDQLISTWKNSSKIELNTENWRAQTIQTLFIDGTYRATPESSPTPFNLPLPPVSILPKNGKLNPREMLSFRGNRIIHLPSPQEGMNAFTYPTCTSWRNNNKDIFFESDALQGKRSATERYLYMTSIETGERTLLATLQTEDTTQYGNAHTGASSQYHFDYAPETDMLVYYDMTGHHLYTLKPGGKPIEVLHLKTGRIGDPPAISHDGKRILIYGLFPEPEKNEIYYGRTSKIFIIDIDPKTGAALGAPKTVFSYPWKNAKGRNNSTAMNFIAVNHVQFNPTDSSKLLYAHEGFYELNGQPDNARIWHIRDNGSDNHSLAPEHEGGENFYSHELYGPMGKYVYAMWNFSLARINVETNSFECIFEKKGPYRTLHVAVSPDEKWVVGDIINGWGEDYSGNAIGGLLLIEMATKKTTLLATFPSGAKHPRHIHPNFSPDGNKIGFTMADGVDGSQIAYVDISDIIASSVKK